MTEQEAVAKAQAVASARGWPWEAPVNSKRYRRFLLGSPRWEILSNASARGLNVRILLDDATGDVLEAHYLPR